MAILNRPLRVMHIISGDLWAGAEVQAFTLLQQLQAKVQLHVVLMNSGELLQKLEALNIPVTLVPESQLNSLAIVRKLIRIMRVFKPDILHSHRQKENILGNIANLLTAFVGCRRAKSLRTAHGAPEFSPRGKQRIQVWLDNCVGRHLQQAVIAVSDDLATKLKAIFQASNIYVIRNGVDPDALLSQAKPADFRSQYPHHQHIGIIGRLEPVKRIDIFLDAATLLLDQATTERPLRFHIIGSGSLKTQLENKAAELGLSEQIQFHGHRTDMASCIHSLDIIVMCSDHEGTPMTALEAMALGTPLIAHNTGGLQDILQDYPQLLVSNHSPAGYALAVQSILDSDPIEISLPVKYSAKQNVEHTLKLYHALNLSEKS